jgi:hypothetical protein
VAGPADGDDAARLRRLEAMIESLTAEVRALRGR